MIFALEALPAKHGDCLLLHYGTEREPKLAVIDGGPGGVYEGSFKPRIGAIRANLRLLDTSALPIELLMVSHVDDDHINGVLQWTGELAALFEGRQPLPTAIRRVWHNSFDRVLDTMPRELSSTVLSSLLASSGVTPSDAATLDDPDKNKLAALKVLASVRQGDQLRQNIDKLGLPSNHPFAGLIMARGDATSVVSLPGELKLTVVGPLKAELVNLQEEHDKWVRAQKKDEEKAKEDANAALAAYVDKSVANLSSIAVLAEAGGKRILLTGDARGDKLIDGLEDAGLLKTGQTLHVEVLKLPHHGSDHNVDHDFFRRITADDYVASGDGKHGNPERKTLEMIFEARKKTDAFTIHLTYDVASVDEKRQRQREQDIAKAKKEKAKQEEKAKKEKAKKEKAKKGKAAPKKVVVPKPWSKDIDALSTFFAKVKPQYPNFRLVEAVPGKGVTISLGSEAVPY